jgi:hypothetical protein
MEYKEYLKIVERIFALKDNLDLSSMNYYTLNVLEKLINGFFFISG